MATPRLSRLHKRILQWLAADHQRTKGVILSSHEELVKALQRDKGTISRSLRLLEGRGWIVIGRSPGGKAHHLTLTPGVSVRWCALPPGERPMTIHPRPSKSRRLRLIVPLSLWR